MSSGDCLVTERLDGRFDVFKLSISGVPQPIRRDISDPRMAWLVAQTKLFPNGHDVYYKRQGEPDTAVRVYRPR
jgi:hypothetical protein